MSYSLIIPIYNEGTTLKRLLNELNKLDESIEIILINDGSNDETKSILDNQNSIRVIHNLENKGKGSSIIIGANSACHNNLILMDGDLEIDIESIIPCIKLYESKDKHVVVGSRWNNKSKTGININTIGNIIINYIFNILFKTNLKDILCCVKIIDQELLNSLDLNSKRFSIEAEIMSKLAMLDTEIYEIDVVYNRRNSDQGKKLKISDSLNIIWTMIKVRFQ